MIPQQEVSTEPKPFPFELAVPSDNGGLPVRHDQVATCIFKELRDSAIAANALYSEGKVQESYEALQETLAAGAELLKGFGMEPNFTVKKTDVWDEKPLSDS